MSGLKKRFNYMFSSGLDRMVLNLFNNELTGFIDEEACEQLAYIIENKSSRYTRKEAFECLLKYGSRPVSYPSALRTLMVLHKLVHMQGAMLSNFLINNQLDNLAKFKVVNLPLKMFIHTAIVPHYYKYLQKLSYNYDDFSICFFQNSDFTERLRENDLSVLHFISKVQNILEYLLDILPLLEVSITQFGKTDLIRQITYFCLTDCYYYYTYISQIISYMIGEIFKLQEQDAIFLYELYSEHIKVTRKLEPLFQLRNHLREFHMKSINFYKIDNELNRNVELYISSLKKGHVKAPEKEKQDQKENEAGKGSLKAKLSSKLEINVDDDDEEETIAPPNHKQPSSLAELSNVLIQITTPNFKSVQKKELFKPPVVHTRGQRVKSPTIVVISPTGQVQEGTKVLESASKKNGNKGISDFNPFTAKTNNFMRLANKEVIFSDESDASQQSQQQNFNGYAPVATATPVRSPNDSMADSYMIQRQ